MATPQPNLEKTLSVQELRSRHSSWLILQVQVQGLLERTLERQKDFSPKSRDEMFPQNESYRSQLAEIRKQVEYNKFRSRVGPAPANLIDLSDASAEKAFEQIESQTRQSLKMEKSFLARYGDGKLDLKRDFFNPLISGISNIPSAIGAAANVYLLGEGVYEEQKKGKVGADTLQATSLILLGALLGRKKGFLVVPRTIGEATQLHALSHAAALEGIGKEIVKLELSADQKLLFSKEIIASYGILQKAIKSGLTPEIVLACQENKKVFIKMLDQVTMTRGQTEHTNELGKALATAIANLDRFAL